MKCVICRNGETRSGKVTATLERDETTLIVRGVPAEVCENCGEGYVEDTAAVKLLQTAGSEVDSLTWFTNSGV